jgi:hypothetical protein
LQHFPIKNYLATDIENGWQRFGLKNHFLAMLFAPSVPWPVISIISVCLVIL